MAPRRGLAWRDPFVPRIHFVHIYCKAHYRNATLSQGYNMWNEEGYSRSRASLIETVSRYRITRNNGSIIVSYRLYVYNRIKFWIKSKWFTLRFYSNWSTSWINSFMRYYLDCNWKEFMIVFNLIILDM